MSNFILASSSVKKLILLHSIGYKPNKVISANIEKVPFLRESPVEYTKRMAFKKSFKIYRKFSDSLVLSSNTVLSKGNLILTEAKIKLMY